MTESFLHQERGTSVYWAQPDNLPTSGIREILDIALQMSGAIRLETGEPNFPPDPAVIDAFYEAARAGHNRYTSSWGILPLREALADKIRSVNHVIRSPEEILVTPGGSPGLFLAFLGTLGAGDQVLVPNPGWPDYLGGIRALHLDPIFYPLPAPQFWPDLSVLEELVTPRTRAIVVNFPGNPAGSIPPRTVIEALVEFAHTHDLWIISDEVYDQIVYTDTVLSPAQLAPERTISVYSFSKTYAMTGWRLGYVALPWPYSESLNRIAMGLWSSVAEPLQYAGLTALKTGSPGITTRLEHYRRRRDLALNLLNSYQIPCHRPDGAFYLLVDISRTGMRSRDFALQLLEQEKVAVAPGSAFGSMTDHYVRISLASSEEDLTQGLTILAQVLQNPISLAPRR
ncbi:aspartate aminotransferase [Sulfobacillus thermosulfidooxidans DSM 9293]|uniref:Aminotransferase n=1 Tax=Sulfobacillus thermosulfidooxidans (strain DSM 9293 / VKM B-1269 / AT-1) TaxID=929705 RepID=A0A1W1W8Z5_SULTA|nr:aspartate aminotransferase [Sulfobacillus thermosulfidooxidans DSM 9293]